MLKVLLKGLPLILLVQPSYAWATFPQPQSRPYVWSQQELRLIQIEAQVGQIVRSREVGWTEVERGLEQRAGSVGHCGSRARSREWQREPEYSKVFAQHLM